MKCARADDDDEHLAEIERGMTDTTPPSPFDVCVHICSCLLHNAPINKLTGINLNAL